MNIHDFLLRYRVPLFDKEDEGAGAGSEGEEGKEGKEGKQGEEGSEGSEGSEGKSKLDEGLLGRRKKEEGGEGDKPIEKKEEAPDDGRPEGLADKFWDADKKEIKTDEMAKSYTELEKAHGKLKREKSIGGEVPEKAEDYFPEGLELGDEVDRLSIDGPDDPGLKSWGEVCHKYGIGKELAVNLAKDMFGMMNEHADAPVDPDVEFDNLGKGADAIIDGVFVWLDGAEKSGKMSEGDIEIAADLSKTANGMRFLSAMRSIAGEEKIPFIHGSGQKGMSQVQWHSEYKQAVQDKDYKRQEELDAMSADVIGDHASSGGRMGGYDAEKKFDKKRSSK